MRGLAATQIKVALNTLSLFLKSPHGEVTIKFYLVLTAHPSPSTPLSKEKPGNKVVWIHDGRTVTDSTISHGNWEQSTIVPALSTPNVRLHLSVELFLKNQHILYSYFGRIYNVSRLTFNSSAWLLNLRNSRDGFWVASVSGSAVSWFSGPGSAAGGSGGWAVLSASSSCRGTTCPKINKHINNSSSLRTWVSLFPWSEKGDKVFSESRINCGLIWQV